MKLNFLCANHREWLQGRPDQALHWCANSYDTGRSLSERDHWDEALVHMGCAFETAEIVLTTRAIALMTGLEWFVQTLEGLTQALEKSGRAEAATENTSAILAIDSSLSRAPGHLQTASAQAREVDQLRANQH